MSAATILGQLQHLVLTPFGRSLHRREVRKATCTKATAAPEMSSSDSTESVFDPATFAAVSLAMNFGQTSNAFAALMYSGLDPQYRRYDAS